MYNPPEIRPSYTITLLIIFGVSFFVPVDGGNAQTSATPKSIVEKPGMRGRTIAFRPLDEKSLKKGLRYQVFETSITGLKNGDSTLRDSLVTVNDVLLTKSQDGYFVQSTPKSVKRFMNGASIDDPMSQLVVGVPAKLQLNSVGIAIEFTGLEAIREKLASKFPADSVATIMKSIGGAAVKMRAIGEWNGRLANLLNREMVIGDARFDTGDVQLPNGHRLQSFIISRIEDTIRIQGIWHVKVKITAATNPKDISTASELPFRDVLRGFKLADSTLASYPMSKGAMIMKTELLLEMNTLRLKTEDFSRTFFMEPELQNNQPVYTRTMSYQRTLRYLYQ